MVSHVLCIRDEMKMMTELVMENQIEMQKWQKQWYDRTACVQQLQPDEKVLVLSYTTNNKLTV